MIKFIKSFFGGKPAEAAPVVDTRVEAANSAPYKVETPAVAPVATPVAEVTPKKKPAPKKQQFAKKAPAAKKPATAKAPAKKPAPKKSKPAA